MLSQRASRGHSSVLRFARPLGLGSQMRACSAAPAPGIPVQRPEPVPQNVPIKMTASEAFVETLVSQGVTDVFGIVGSAFMDALDLFPEAGIRFISVQHEQNAAHMADGFARASGRHGVCTAQNGPGKIKLLDLYHAQGRLSNLQIQLHHTFCINI